MWSNSKASQLTTENLAQHNELYDSPKHSTNKSTSPITSTSHRQESMVSDRGGKGDLSVPLTGGASKAKKTGILPEMVEYSEAPNKSTASHLRVCCLEFSCCSATNPFLVSCFSIALETTLLLPCYCAYKTRCRRRGAWRCCCPAEPDNARRWHAQYPIGCWDWYYSGVLSS
jgi:hypothetical protein